MWDPCGTGAKWRVLPGLGDHHHDDLCQVAGTCTVHRDAMAMSWQCHDNETMVTMLCYRFQDRTVSLISATHE